MQIRAVTCLLGAFLALAAGGAVLAAEVEGLYSATVPVAGKDAAERKAALGRALLGVLVKVSGDRSPGQNPAVAGALRRAPELMQQYQYETVSASSRPGPAEQLVLVAQFDRTAVDEVLREAGLPVWGRVRPAVLAWLVVEGPGGRDLVGAGDESGYFAALTEGAVRRGLAVVAPLLDLEDRRAIRVSDIWGGFNDSVRRASARYRSEAVLTGRVSRVLPTLWEGRWTLIERDSVVHWTSRADHPAAVVEEGVHGAADRLAAAYARVASASGEEGLRFSVTGIDSLEGYARTVAYLDSLDLVTRVRVSRVEPGRVAFDVGARGGLDALKQVIALGRTLVHEGAPDDPRFRLLP